MNPRGALAAVVLLAGPLTPPVSAAPALVAAPQLLERSPLRHGEARGRVLSPAGEPLAGADIALVPLSDDVMGGSDLEASLWLEPQDEFDLVEHTTTGADGRFVFAPSPAAPDARIDALYSGIEWVLFVSAPDCRPLARDWPSAAGPLLDFGDLQLAAGGGLTGRVVDQDGAPFVGAEVNLSSSWPDGRFAYRASSAQFLAFRARTDADGRFAFPSVRSTPLYLDVGHREATGRARETVVAPAAGTIADVGELRLTRGGRIAGRVVDAHGAPVPGARVYVGDGTLSIDRTQEADPIVVARNAFARRGCVFGDAEGRFTATGIPGPSAHLLVLAPGCEGALLRCIPAGAEDLVVALEPEGRLLVQVTDAASEESIAAAEVIAVRSGGQSMGGDSLALPVRRLGGDDETLFEISQVGPALHFVQVTAPGYAPTWVEPDGVAPGKFRLVTVALRRAALLQGLVSDADDRPLTGVSVSAMNIQALFSPDFLVKLGRSARVPIRDRAQAKVLTDAEGRFTFFELTPALWSMEAALNGYKTGEDAVGTLSYGTTRSSIIRLHPAGPAEIAEDAEMGRSPGGDEPPRPGEVVVRGRVVAGGAPVAGAGVWAELAGSNSLLRQFGKLPGSLGAEGTDYHDRPEDSRAETRCDRGGVYELRLPSGSDWRLCAASPQGGLLLEPSTLSIPAQGDADVPAGAPSETLTRDLELGTRRATVTVLDQRDGRPLPDCWVWIDPGPIHWLAPNAWRTDERGRVELQHLQPGSYVATAVLGQPGSDDNEPPEHAALSSIPFTVPADEDVSVEVRLPSGLSLEGLVRSADGVPVPDGTPVLITHEGRSVTARTVDGRFRAVGLEPGACRARVTASGDHWTSDVVLGEAQVELMAGATVSEPIHCELELVFPGAKPYRRELTREEYYAPTDFDSVQWKDKQLVGEGVRIRMIDDLLARHEFVGMTRADVLELLGQPDGRFTEEPVLTWYLGDERSAFAIDSEWLSLTLGADDQVTEERVWAD